MIQKTWEAQTQVRAVKSVQNFHNKVDFIDWNTCPRMPICETRGSLHILLSHCPGYVSKLTLALNNGQEILRGLGGTKGYISIVKTGQTSTMKLTL